MSNASFYIRKKLGFLLLLLLLDHLQFLQRHTVAETVKINIDSSFEGDVL